MHTTQPLVAFRPQGHGVHPAVAAALDRAAVKNVSEFGVITAQGTFRNLTQYQPIHAEFHPRLNDADPDRRRKAAPHAGKTVIGAIDHGPSYLHPGQRSLSILLADATALWATSGELHTLTVHTAP